jgi:hypothetical protein
MEILGRRNASSAMVFKAFRFVRDLESDLVTADLLKKSDVTFGRDVSPMNATWFEVSAMQFRSLLITSLAMLVTQTHLGAAVPEERQTKQPTSVAIVELFTSEGCSSCPPADALLQRVHLRQLSAGQLIVGLSEHVTYWDHLGWKDPFSDQVFTDRQSVYASRLSPEGPYTPQMVLNGRDQFLGSDGRALEDSLRADVQRKHASLKIVALARGAEGLDLQFSLTGSAPKPIEIIAVLTDDADRSEVLRGENSGRSLQHVSVARSLSRVATVAGDTERSVHLSLPQGFQRDASGHHLVLFAQEAHQGAIVAAAVMAL